MENQLAVNANKKTIGDLIASKKNELSAALPKHLNADRLLRICLTEIQKNPKLQQCTASSLAGAVMQAAQLGLEPGGFLGHCYFVPFRNNKKNCSEVQFIPGYKGLIELAIRSGRVSTISARIVYNGDKFFYEYGTNERLEHTPDLKSDRSIENIRAVYALAKLNEGGIKFEVFSVPEINDSRFESKDPDGIWKSDYEEMAKKTAIRKFCKYLTLSPELQKAVTIDEYGSRGLPVDDTVFVDVEVKKNGKEALMEELDRQNVTPVSDVVNEETSFANLPSNVEIQEPPKLKEEAPKKTTRADLAVKILMAGKIKGLNSEGIANMCVKLYGNPPDKVSINELETMLRELQS